MEQDIQHFEQQIPAKELLPTDYQLEARKYCMCGVTSISETIKIEKSEEIKDIKLENETSSKWKTRNIIHNLTSETNISNLEQLKGYPYSSEYRRNHKSDKMIVVYKCGFDHCQKEFLRTWNLLDHLRMHYRERPFICQFCRKTFTQRGNLRKHLLQHYMPTLDQRKKYRCSHCASSFTERYNFRVSDNSLTCVDPFAEKAQHPSVSCARKTH